VRSLDPGLRRLPAEALALPVPNDVLRRASQIVVTRCGPAIVAVEVLTDPTLAPDMGLTTVPFVASTTIDREGTCRDEILYASPTQYLLDLVDSGDALAIVG
jgi:hypothetical protein